MNVSEQTPVWTVNRATGQPVSLVRLLMPWQMVHDLRRHSSLIWQFTKRDVLMRYRGSYLGILWSLLRPLCMLAVFFVVFGYIFQSRWGHDQNETRIDYALGLFCGLIAFDFMAECLARAPTLVLSNPNYVTRVVFPVEILPVSAVGGALLHMVLSSIPLCLGYLFVHGSLHLTALYLPLIFIPLALLGLGLTWLFASLGVFIRDINSFVPVLITILMYASAIFYPISRVPAAMLPAVIHNPLAVLVENTRNVFMWGMPLNWGQYLSATLLCLVIMLFGYGFFMKTKNAFADVV
ncbi:MAG TPA: ABC transporter permease [Verrucomicrobiae bacterium]|nr:ABC transporter permease [Verrucomicrobiae bacterium]